MTLGSINGRVDQIDPKITIRSIDNLSDRRLKVGSLDVHPRERAIVVSYDVEATLVGENGEKMLEQSKSCQKV